MVKDYMVGAEEIATELGISKGHAYKLIRKMNQELAAQGYMIISGRLPRSFIETKFFGFGDFKKLINA